MENTSRILDYNCKSVILLRIRDKTSVHSWCWKRHQHCALRCNASNSLSSTVALPPPPPHCLKIANLEAAGKLLKPSTAARYRREWVKQRSTGCWMGELNEDIVVFLLLLAAQYPWNVSANNCSNGFNCITQAFKIGYDSLDLIEIAFGVSASIYGCRLRLAMLDSP